MHQLISTTTGKSKAVKGLELLKCKHLKTRTNLDINFSKDDRAKVDVFSAVAGDIDLLGVAGESIGDITVTVESAPALGRLINRSITTFAKIGIGVGTDLDWPDKSGVYVLSVQDATAYDLAYIAEVVTRLSLRALAAISETHHALTLFDLKQAIGIVHDVKQGVEGAQDVLDWINVRELLVAEEVKAAKAEARAAKRAEAKEAKAKAGTTSKGEARAKAAKAKAAVKARAAKAKGKGKGKPRGKATPKATEKNAASLSDLS